jgi:hypothetical protein
MSYIYLVIGVLISYHGIQKIVKNKNISKKGNLKEIKVHGHI